MNQETGKRLALDNGRIALPAEIVEGLSLVIEDEAILGIAKRDELGSGLEHLDVEGRLIAPGLIDIHTHGALGHSFDEASESAWEIIAAENARRGITSLLATLVAAPLPDLLASLGFAREWMRRAALPGAGRSSGAQILGLHLESPYISPSQCGALDPASLRLPDGRTGQSWIAISDLLKISSSRPSCPAPSTS